MLNWQVGAVEITCVVETLMSLPYDPETFFLRDATPQALKASWATTLDSDTQAATSTRAKLFAEWANQPILVIGTHYAAPTAGHVKRDGAAFRFEV